MKKNALLHLPNHFCRKCHYATSMVIQPSSPITPSKPTTSFHKRPLPKELVAMSSAEGRKIFREALDGGGMECYFPLAEQFITQSDPSFCSVSTLAMVMNALNFDLKRIWKGPWRWVSEEMLQCESQSVCGHSINRVKEQGMNFKEFESLARCHGVKIKAFPVCACVSDKGPCDEHAYEAFRKSIAEICSREAGDRFLVVNFSRKAIGQTGDGHYSPIGGFHRERDLVLVLDVARFKYPPFWVPVRALWESMSVIDKATGRPRGYFIISGWDQDQRDKESLSSAGEKCPSGIRSWVEARPTNEKCSRSHNHNHSHHHHHDHSHGNCGSHDLCSASHDVAKQQPVH